MIECAPFEAATTTGRRRRLPAPMPAGYDAAPAGLAGTGTAGSMMPETMPEAPAPRPDDDRFAAAGALLGYAIAAAVIALLVYAAFAR